MMKEREREREREREKERERVASSRVHDSSLVIRFCVVVNL